MYTKCPRCELNYITEGEQYCRVCMEELQGESYSYSLDMCFGCGEELALPGYEYCEKCLNQMRKKTVETDIEEDANEKKVELDPISYMDDSVPDEDEKDDMLSLESVIDSEEDEEIDESWD